MRHLISFCLVMATAIFYVAPQQEEAESVLESSQKTSSSPKDRDSPGNCNCDAAYQAICQECLSCQLSNVRAPGECEGHWENGFFEIDVDCPAGCFCAIPDIGLNPGNSDPQQFDCVMHPNANATTFFVTLSDPVSGRVTPVCFDISQLEQVNQFKIRVENKRAASPYYAWEIVAEWDDSVAPIEPGATRPISNTTSGVATVRRSTTKFGDVAATIPFVASPSGSTTDASYHFGSWRVTFKYKSQQ